MADRLVRPLSVHFKTRYLGRLSLDNILASLKIVVDEKEINAIQLTEDKCVVTLKNEESKQSILLNGLNINNRYVNITDVDNLVTNVTLKDAPYELSDPIIMGSMSQYGEIMPGSFVRGKIRNTNIENGTRYLKILSCVPLLPPVINVGQFTIRVFGDNNRTACRICGFTDHPSFKCPRKINDQQAINGKPTYSSVVKRTECYNCKSTDHLKRECPRGIICHYCMQEGHKAADCNADMSVDGDESSDNDSDVYDDVQEGVTVIDATEGATTRDVPEGAIGRENMEQSTTSKAEKKIHVIIGDSNGVRLHLKNPDVRNMSMSGYDLTRCDELISKIDIMEDVETVAGVVIHLGTNDMAHKSVEDICVSAANAMQCVANKWPNSPIAFSSIIPRRGKTTLVKAINEAAVSVNNSVLELCKITRNYHFLNNDNIFYDGTKFMKSLYDARDMKGVHVSDEGAEELYQSFLSFFYEGESDELDCTTLIDDTRKRERGSSSTTPTSDTRKTKQSKK